MEEGAGGVRAGVTGHVRLSGMVPANLVVSLSGQILATSRPLYIRSVRSEMQLSVCLFRFCQTCALGQACLTV